MRNGILAGLLRHIFAHPFKSSYNLIVKCEYNAINISVCANIIEFKNDVIFIQKDLWFLSDIRRNHIMLPVIRFVSISDEDFVFPISARKGVKQAQFGLHFYYKRHLFESVNRVRLTSNLNDHHLLSAGSFI